MKGDNQYYCDKCDKKVDAIKGMKIKRFAPFLQFSLNRFIYDMRTYQRVKVNSHCEFPLVIDTSLFLSDKKENIKDIKSNMIWISDLSSTDKIKKVIEKSKSYSNCSDVYDLVAIVCHNGSAFGGHYTVYIRDVFNEGKCNDSNSTETTTTNTKSEGINEDNNSIFTNTWLDKLMDYYYGELIGKLEEKGLKIGGLFEFILKLCNEDFKKGFIPIDSCQFRGLFEMYRYEYLKDVFGESLLEYIKSKPQCFLVCKADNGCDAVLLKEMSNNDLESILIEERTFVNNCILLLLLLN